MEQQPTPEKTQQDTLQQGNYYQAMAPQEIPEKNPGRVNGIIGIICGSVSIVFFPPVFGILGIVLGVKAKRKGAYTTGLLAISLSSIFMILGIFLNVWVALHPEILFGMDSPLPLLIFIIFGLTIICPVVFWFWFFMWQDRADPEPRKLLIKAFFLGVFLIIPAGLIEFEMQSILFPGNDVLVSLSLLDNSGLGSVFVLAATLFIAGIVEEIAKYLGLKGMVYNRASFNQIFDGVFYAATLAIGFSTAENILYFIGFLSEELSSIEFAVAAVSRAVISMLLHITAASITGYALGRMKFTKEHDRMLVFKGVLLAILLHGVFNVLLIFPYGPIVSVIAPVLIFVYLIKISSRAENRLVWRLVNAPLPEQSPPAYTPK